MTRSMTMALDARHYEDEDDCLTAAADEVRADLGLQGWDLGERWGDDDRTIVVLTIPRPGVNDAAGWDRVPAEETDS